jgi:hypothetical protein
MHDHWLLSLSYGICIFSIREEASEHLSGSDISGDFKIAIPVGKKPL